MIPLRYFRVFVALLSVSAILALADTLLLKAGVEQPYLGASEGLLSGCLVGLLAYYLGSVFRFVGKGFITDPAREALVWNALEGMGLDRSSLSVSVMDSDRFVLNTQVDGGHHRTFISRFVIDKLSPVALRGAMAHECGHLRARHPLKLAILLGLIASVKLSIGVPMLVAIVVLVSFMYLMRQWEFEADASGSSIAGVDTLRTSLADYQELMHPKDEHPALVLLSSYPNFSDRLKALEALQQ